MGWEESIRKMHNTLLELEGKKTRLRHDSSHLNVSDLADQYYCEMKVEQRYIHGEIEKEEKEIGSILHEELSHLERVDMESIIKDIKEKGITFASLPLLGRFDDVVIFGNPDIVVFSDSKPLYVMELKTTKGKPSIWPSNWLQAQIYAYLLDEMEFNCSDLDVVVASISQQREISRGEFYGDLLQAIIDEKTDEFARKWLCKVRMEPYCRDFVEDKIGWALGYWQNKREPTPTKKPGKCISCEYAKSCPANLLASSN